MHYSGGSRSVEFRVMMSPHCGLEHTELTLTIRAVLIHGQEKNMFIFLKSNTSEEKSINKFIQRLDLRKYGSHRVLK